MTPNNLRQLAESLELGFMTEADRKSWVNDLRAHARSVERAIMVEGPSDRPEIPDGGADQSKYIHQPIAGCNAVLKAALAPKEPK